MNTTIQILSELAGWLAGSAFLYWGVRLVREKGTFGAMLAITLLSSFAGAAVGWFNPFLGGVAGWIVLLILLKKLTTVRDIWPTAVLVTIVAWLLKILVVFGLIGLLTALLAGAAVAV